MELKSAARDRLDRRTLVVDVGDGSIREGTTVGFQELRNTKELSLFAFSRGRAQKAEGKVDDTSNTSLDE